MASRLRHHESNSAGHCTRESRVQVVTKRTTGDCYNRPQEQALMRLEPLCNSMKSKTEPTLSRQLSSNASIFLFSFLSGAAVFACAILLQWLIYADWLHSTAPLRFTGSVLASALTFTFVMRWQSSVRERRLEMLRRFERIAQMNDRIRNALQVIELVTYATNPQATAPVRDAVDVIEGVLHEVLTETHPASPDPPPTSTTTPKSETKADTA